jgi:hypothetical protein
MQNDSSEDRTTKYLACQLSFLITLKHFRGKSGMAHEEEWEGSGALPRTGAGPVFLQLDIGPTLC